MGIWRSPVGFFLFIFLLKVANNRVECGDPVGLKLELIHRHDPRIQGDHVSPLPRHERLRQLIETDKIRLQSNHSRRGRRRGPRVFGQVGLYSGSDFGNAVYYVHVRIGTPPQNMVMVADTGSDLTWIMCERRCGLKGCHLNTTHFVAGLSSSYRTVPCSSTMCKEDLASLFSIILCPYDTYPCAYDYSYADGSRSPGSFSLETITFNLTNGKERLVPDVIIGCSNRVRSTRFEGAHGIVGLGFNNYSFVRQVSKVFGGKFSYCLVDHLSHTNVSSHLTFGKHKRRTVKRMKRTKLFLDVIGSQYAVNVSGLSLNGTMLSIPYEVWDLDDKGGVTIDSGSTVSTLTPQAYRPLTDALNKAMSIYPRVQMEGQLDYCFNTSWGLDHSSVPKLRIHFSDGTVFEPPVDNYVIARGDGVSCLGFMIVAWPSHSVIGNIMQQNHLWQFDLIKRRLGFLSATCSSL